MKNGSLNLDIGINLRNKFKVVCAKNETTMKNVVIDKIIEYIQDHSQNGDFNE